MRTSDVRWIGLKPESVKTLGAAEHWHVRWVKQLPPEVKEKNEYDILLELGFTRDQLTRVKIPERYFAVMPKQFLVGVIRSLGKGRIDKSQKRIEATVSAAEVAAGDEHVVEVGLRRHYAAPGTRVDRFARRECQQAFVLPRPDQGRRPDPLV